MKSLSVQFNVMYIHTPRDAQVVNVPWPFVLKFGTNITICNSFDKFVDQKNPLVFYWIRQISQSAIEFVSKVSHYFVIQPS